MFVVKKFLLKPTEIQETDEIGKRQVIIENWRSVIQKEYDYSHIEMILCRRKKKFDSRTVVARTINPA